jgi:hypothetical protein
MSASCLIERAIDDIAPLTKALEAQGSDPYAIIIEANKKLATLNLRCEAWVDSGIGRTMFGYAQVPDDESPTKNKWGLAFDIENLGRSIESLLIAPRVVQTAALKRLPYLLKACSDAAALGSKSANPSDRVVSSVGQSRHPLAPMSTASHS